MSSRVGSRIVAVGVAAGALAALAAPPAQSAVRTVSIDRGSNRVELSVPHRTGGRPPAILLATRPADAPCVVTDYAYRAKRKRVAKRAHGRLSLRLRCRSLPRRSRVRLEFRDPYTRVFPIRDGSGTVRIRVDKPPGDVLPLARLTTRPRHTDCRATRTTKQVTAHVFTAGARVRCRRLPARAKGVLAVGGLLASTRVKLADPDPPEPDATTAKGCDSPRTLSFLGHSLSWKYCYTADVTLGPWESKAYGSRPNPRCASPWKSALELPDRELGALLNGAFPADVVVDPDDAWAWSLNWFPVVGWYVTNWQFSGDIIARWQYNCYLTS